MSKSNKLYKIFMTSMIVIIAGLLLATGIIAVQKHLKLKMEIAFQPGVQCAIGVVNFKTGDEIMFLKNFEDENGSVEVNGGILDGSKLILTQDIVETYGMSVEEVEEVFGLYLTAFGTNFDIRDGSVLCLMIMNYTSAMLEVSLNLSHGEVLPVEWLSAFMGVPFTGVNWVIEPYSDTAISAGFYFTLLILTPLQLFCLTQKSPWIFN